MEERRRPRNAVVAFVVVAVLVVVGVLVAVVVLIFDDRPVVAIVGDSITVVSMPALEGALGSDYELDVAAALGVQVGQMQDRADELADRRPEVAVIELGSNDVLQGAELTDTAAGMRRMADVLLDGGASCVHIVNASTSMHRGNGDPTGDRARELNAMTAAMVEQDERLVIVDWAGALAEAHERGEDLTPDTVHPEEAGAALLADLLATSLAEGCPAEG